MDGTKGRLPDGARAEDIAQAVDELTRLLQGERCMTAEIVMGVALGLGRFVGRKFDPTGQKIMADTVREIVAEEASRSTAQRVLALVEPEGRA